MRFTRLLLASLAVLAVTAAVATARPPADRQVPADGLYSTHVRDTGEVFDANEMSMFVTNVGSFAYDAQGGGPGLEWPQGSNKHAIFAAGLWLGARVGGQVRVVVAEYSQEFAAGPLNASGAPVDPTETDNRWRVLKLTPADIAAGTGDDYATWRQTAADLGEDGPPVDAEGNPDIGGADQMLWCVYNDAVAARHTNDAGLSDPLGVEVRQKVFGFNRSGALGKTVFIEYEIENKGSNVLEDMYISLWSDPDLGGSTDDLVGADTLLSLGYCYNATNTDNNYGANVPAIGYDFFLGPDIGGGMTLPMTSFNKYINGTDPGSAQESYNYMQGLEANGDPQTCDGVVTTFVLTGDPVRGTSCIDSDPADRRLMLSTGPITMNPGEEQRIVAALVIGGVSGQGDRLSNISLLKFYDLAAQDAFDRDFQVPQPPPAPVVKVTELDGELILSWGAVSQRNYDQEGYEFEGYNVYQGSAASGPFRLIATYDVVNGIAQITDKVFNAEIGGLEERIVQRGADSGVEQEIVLTEDAIRGGPLRNGRPYYFAVTAYAYGADAPDGGKTLENSFSALTVVPQKLVAGVDLNPVTVSAVTYAPADGGVLPPPTSTVTVRVVDATAVTGHNYMVAFRDVTPFDVSVDGTMYPVASVWDLIDTSVSPPDTVLQDQFNVTGNGEYEIADGLQVVVSGVFDPQLQDAAYANRNATNGRGLSWVDWGGRFFNGGADTGCLWAGSSIIGAADEQSACPDAVLAPDRFGTVELRFVDDPADGQKAYLYYRKELADGGSPPGGRGYPFIGYVDVPFTCWKVVGDVETQIQVMFTERQVVEADGVTPAAEQPATQDGTWKPSDEDVGGREYLNILDVPYGDGQPVAEYMVGDLFFSGEIPVLYGAWLRQRGSTGVVDEGDAFVFTWGNPADSNDRWTFSTTPATGVVDGRIAGDDALAQSRRDLKQIRVVPNPYLTRSAYELDQFNRVVKFVNLPATCTVRIFTLAGDMIRVIEKDDATTSIAEWDLKTRFNLPVGSGIYVYHVEAPGIGNTFGKMAVFMEAERLQEY